MREPKVDVENLNEAQQKAFDGIAAGPRGRVAGPFVPLLHSPEICDYVQRTGAYIRWESKIPALLREFAICLVARFWVAQYEWNAHSKIALDLGLDQAILDAVAARRKPDLPDRNMETIYSFCTEMLETKRVSDATYAATLELLGPEQLVDLVGLMGYYSLIGMTLNTFDVEVPAGGVTPLDL